MLIANLTPAALTVPIAGAGEEHHDVRRLSERTVEQAVLEPDRFRSSAAREPLSELALSAYETVRIDSRP